jgi:hypothetical protein
LQHLKKYATQAYSWSVVFRQSVPHGIFSVFLVKKAALIGLCRRVVKIFGRWTRLQSLLSVPPLFEETRELKARHLTSVFAEIESKRSASGRIPRGEISKVFNEQKPIYTWVTMDIIKKRFKKS